MRCSILSLSLSGSAGCVRSSAHLGTDSNRSLVLPSPYQPPAPPYHSQHNQIQIKRFLQISLGGCIATTTLNIFWVVNKFLSVRSGHILFQEYKFYAATRTKTHCSLSQYWCGREFCLSLWHVLELRLCHGRTSSWFHLLFRVHNRLFPPFHLINLTRLNILFSVQCRVLSANH